MHHNSASISAQSMAWIRLASAYSVATKKWLMLLSELNCNPQELLTSTSKASTVKSAHKTATLLFDKISEQSVEKALIWLDGAPERCIITFECQEYPEMLKTLDSPPFALFVIGNPLLLQQPQVAMVGSRRASYQGKSIAEDIATALANAGITVTSGMALGIDAAAHKGALKGIGKTIAIMGTGPDTIYPYKHRPLHADILNADGAVITEFFPSVPAKAWHFPRRNRLIAAISLGTLVVEAKIKSGTLITANLAADLGRDVFAIPGSIYHSYSEGCHWLIQQGAKLVTNVNDIFDELAIEPLYTGDTLSGENEKSEVNSLATDQLLASVDYNVTAIDVIAQRGSMPVQQAMALLLEYELCGLVTAVPGGYIKLRGK
ncbi:DNA-processing protein DprA [Alteromonas sp. A081]|uniref:DNA-processing protein DprA n=1 Tax=Alteromonas sp. A081 TaxID=3410269 RepID=UPI003B987431